MTHAEAVIRLRGFIARFPSQKAAAEELGIAQSFLSDILNGRRDLTDRILNQLGLAKEVVINPIKQSKAS